VPQWVCLRRIVLDSRLRRGALLRERNKCRHTLDRSLNRSVTHLCLFAHGVDLNIIDPLAVTHNRLPYLAISLGDHMGIASLQVGICNETWRNRQAFTFSCFLAGH
jgi:hypothetical protein